MVGRSIKVRQVFAELRRALGAETPAGWAAKAYRDDDPGFVVAKGGTEKVFAA